MPLLRIGCFALCIDAPDLLAQAARPVPVSTVRIMDRASVRLASVLNVFELNRGRVIVNDGSARQLVILDSTLSRVTVLLDSAAGGPEGYGQLAAPLVTYGRDSLLFVDGAARSLLVIDGEGQKRGMIAGPGGSDFRFLAGGYWAADRFGNFLYRVMEMRMTSTPPGERGPGTKQIQAFPDSATLVRFDLEARRVDTLLRIKQEGGTRGIATIDAAGKRSLTYEINPLSTVDEWVIMADGSLAVVRGLDYHLEVYRAGAAPLIGPKVAFPWRKLSDDDKRRYVDSVQATLDTAQRLAAERGENPDRELIRLLRSVSGAFAAAVPAPPASAPASTPRDPRASTASFSIGFVDASTLPDYFPAFRTGSVRADRMNNVWVLPSTTSDRSGDGLVYDVLDDRGELRRRVRLPGGRSIAGFGHGGIVYMIGREADGRWYLERGVFNVL